MNVNYGAIPIDQQPPPEEERFRCWITEDCSNQGACAGGVMCLSCVVVTVLCAVYPVVCLFWPVDNSFWYTDLLDGLNYDYNNKQQWCEHNAALHGFKNITKCVQHLVRQHEERAACWVKGGEGSGILIAAAVAINLICIAIICASTLRCAYTCPTPRRKVVPIPAPKPNDWSKDVHPL